MMEKCKNLPEQSTSDLQTLTRAIKWYPHFTGHSKSHNETIVQIKYLIVRQNPILNLVGYCLIEQLVILRMTSPQNSKFMTMHD